MFIIPTIADVTLDIFIQMLPASALCKMHLLLEHFLGVDAGNVHNMWYRQHTFELIFRLSVPERMFSRIKSVHTQWELLDLRYSSVGLRAAYLKQNNAE